MINLNIRNSEKRTVELDEKHTALSDEIIRLSGVNINLCWQCRTCAGGCPFSDAMDYLPNQIIRLIQLGMKEQVIKSSSVWICVGCHTCSMECPQAIDMSSVMDAVKQTALAEGIKIGEPRVYDFHKAVLNSIQRYGRTHKLEIMMRYKLSQRDWFSDMDIGLKMLSKRKLDLMPSKVKQLSDIKKIFEKVAMTSENRSGDDI
jgi:heterodisulfide reductase subunit C